MAGTRKQRPAATPQPASRPFLTTAEAAAIACCSRRTLFRWIEAGLVDSSRPVASGSAKRLVVRASLEAFLGLPLEAAA